MSNDVPPRACLDVSPFMTVAPDPTQSSEFSAQPQGCTVQFMAPELLVPEMFGEEGSVPTQRADIYAFGLVIFQVCEQYRGYHLFIYTDIPSLGPYG